MILWEAREPFHYFYRGYYPGSLRACLILPAKCTSGTYVLSAGGRELDRWKDGIRSKCLEVGSTNDLIELVIVLLA
jgi:hypothetical protein